MRTMIDLWIEDVEDDRVRGMNYLFSCFFVIFRGFAPLAYNGSLFVPVHGRSPMICEGMSR